MKIYKQCKCGYLYNLSKLESNFVSLELNSDIFTLKLSDTVWTINYCPDCIGKYPTEKLNNKACCCGLKEELLKREFADFVEKFEGMLFIKLRAIKIPSPNQNEPAIDVSVPFYLPNCFNCGNLFFNSDEMISKGIEQFYSEFELNDLFAKLPLIETKGDVFRLFGKPTDVHGIGYWGQTEKTVDYSYRIIKEAHHYTDTYETINLTFNYFFDGDLGYHLSPK